MLNISAIDVPELLCIFKEYSLRLSKYSSMCTLYIERVHCAWEDQKMLDLIVKTHLPTGMPIDKFINGHIGQMDPTFTRSIMTIFFEHTA